MNKNDKYQIIKNLPIPTIEGVDLIFGDKPVLYGTLSVNTEEDLKDITNKFDLLGLEYQFHKDFESINDINPDNEQVSLNFAIGENKNKIQKFIDYEKSNNHNEMGKLLGYPDCCTSNFYSYFPDDNNRWTGLKIANYLPYRLNDFRIYPFYTNRLLRYSDENALIYHFPCGLDCEESVEIAKKRFEILKDVDPKRAKNMKENLSSVFILKINNNSEGYYEEVVDLVYYSDYQINNTNIKINGSCYKGSDQTNTEFYNKFKNIKTINIDEHNRFSINGEEISDNNIYVIVFN